ncbi:hypothetical protein B0H14DRAFT_2948642 [Mycena olivaceomarginata]|nr:hypothetical protein B0H14DRAFT_2948642 [Mycena olivaceomarginata]
MPPLPSPAAADDEYDVIDVNIDDIPDDVTWFPYAEWVSATDDPSDAVPRLSSPQMISCGVKREYVTSAADTHPWWDAHRAPQLAFLPLPLESRLAPCSPSPYTSTGCGEPVHRVASSFSESPHQTWVAPVDGVARTVIPLEMRYFGAAERNALGMDPDGQETKSCRCVVTGVGCAVCGNPLGALRTLCGVHREAADMQLGQGQTSFVFLSISFSARAPSHSEQHPATQTRPWRRFATRPLSRTRSGADTILNYTASTPPASSPRMAARRPVRAARRGTGRSAVAGHATLTIESGPDSASEVDEDGWTLRRFDRPVHARRAAHDALEAVERERAARPRGA